MRKKTLLKIFTMYILGIVLIQSIIPFALIVFSKVKTNMEDNIIRVDNIAVENRQLVLENDMIEKWSSIHKESTTFQVILEDLLNEKNADIDALLDSREMQQTYLERVFPEMIENLQYNTMSGIFMILANREDIREKADYCGFFVRDSDPENRVDSNADMLMEKGSKQLAHSEQISLDNAWATDFSFEGAGVRAADDFFYEPYEAAIRYPDAAPVNLGYWAKPFILQDDYMDNHMMITYSVPMVYEGVVYGVLGVEASTAFMNKYFELRDLDADLNAGYALAVDHGNGEYDCFLGRGTLYDAVTRKGQVMQLEASEKEALYKVKNAYIGSQEICAVVKPITLYNGNVPYDDTDWVLCGLVTAESVYGMGDSLYQKLLTASVLGMILSIVIVYIMVKVITKPVYRLVDSVRGGVEGIHNFKESFFTYQKDSDTIEIINSRYVDGVWKCSEHPEYIESRRIHPMDREMVRMSVKNADKEINIDFRLKAGESSEYIWVNLTASMTHDADGMLSRMVGCVQNIDQRKMLEEQQKDKWNYDSVTSFYRLKRGLEELQFAAAGQRKGVLVLVNVDQLTKINKRYGLLFGDMVLEKLSGLIVNDCDQNDLTGGIYIRAGIDMMLLWFPDADSKKIEVLLRNVTQEFEAQFDEKYIELTLYCGITKKTKDISLTELIEEAKVALAYAGRGRFNIAVYQELQEEEQKVRNEIVLEEVEDLGRLKFLSMSSIVLNLLDKSGELPVVLDMLVSRFKREYGIKGLVITQFNREYLVNALLYHSNRRPSYEGERTVYCTELEYQEFMERDPMQKLHRINTTDSESKLIGSFAAESSDVIYHMNDGGEYSGSIIFLDMDIEEIRKKAEYEKELNEIGAIIQNKLNMQRHDLSARAKSDFLARMSHEIRTPMNGIMGMTQIALKEGQSEERRIDCLKKIESSSNYLLGLLNDVLDMSKIESGKMKLVEDKFNLSDMAESIRSLMEPRMTEKDMEFITDIQLEHSWLIGDELRLNQVLLNFLSNAVKYTEVGGHIRLSIIEQGSSDGCSEIYFAVKDDGIGVAKDKQQLIFQRFEQADESEKARKQGTGLGLAICTRLIHMMDSKIDLDSTLGEGSTFSFTLRLKQVEKEEISQKADVETADFAGKRVLVVEDNELNMEITCTFLTEFGIIPEEAYNGQEAVERFAESEPGYYDMILMDIMMPVMDGLEATKHIRALERMDSRTIPIYAMSANAFDEDIKRSLNSGMNGHLSKPIHIEKLKEAFAMVFMQN